ncbi:hypothetical protein OIV83_003567 [Microbotryomycetes sp. JL201]|nr:hypothetical protein OIV83_003567 [Microbotryomycetes sp. JL201]
MSSSLEQRLITDFCPPLDSSLVSALLLDFPEPSEDDERQLRSILESLTMAADREDRRQSQTSLRPSHDVEGASQQGHALAIGRSQTPSSAQNSAVSDLGDRFEVWDLAEGDQIAPTDRSAASQRFWDASIASTTSGDSEDYTSDVERAIPDDPLALLASLFPSIGLDNLEKQLTSANNELDKCVENLLSVDLLHQLEEEEKAEQASIGKKSAAPVDKQAKRRVKQAFKAANKISLTSPAYGLPGPPSPAYLAAFPASQTAIAQAAPDSNRWASISSEADQLASMLHIPATKIMSTYYACSCSTALTLSTLLNQLAAARPFSDVPGGHDLEVQLSDILPETSIDHRKMLISATEGDLADAMDLDRKIKEVEASEGKLTWSELVSNEQNNEPSSVAWSPNMTRRQGKLETALNTSSTYDQTAYSVRECATMEADYSQRREEAIRNAMRHFQRGGTAQRGAAYYWAEQGRELDAKRRVWAERHARALVRERQVARGSFVGTGNGPNARETVDLHGLTLHHAQLVVKDALNLWYTNLQTQGVQPGQRPLKIVTGVGRHSAGSTPVLMPSIVKMLDREGWKWKWDGVGESGKGAVAVIGVAK